MRFFYFSPISSAALHPRQDFLKTIYINFSVSHTSIYLWQSATIATLAATYRFSSFGAAHPFSLTKGAPVSDDVI